MVTPDDVDRVYVAGVRAVEAIAGSMSDEDWAQPACGSWSAADTVRHLASVAGWYHHWLDRALDGDLEPPFDGDAIDDHTAVALEQHRHLSGDDAVRRFVTDATAYLERVRAHRELPFSYPFGRVTAGLHAGVAAVEWHLHAWDLSTVADERYVPEEPEVLMVAAGRCVAAARGGVAGAIMSSVVPLAARRAPWETLLRRSGRR